MPFLTPMPLEFQLYDTTLREGALQGGMQLSVADKFKIASYLDALGIHFIELDYQADREFFARAIGELVLYNAKLVAFGALNAAIPGSSLAGVDELAEAETEYVTLAVNAHTTQLTELAGIDPAANRNDLRTAIETLRAAGKQVFIALTHFFDGFYADQVYAISLVRVAASSGAQVVTLCDTNGGMVPSMMIDVVSRAGAMGVDLGIHCHNDSGCAVANSLAAIDAGVMQVQGTINGYGERAGTLDLTTIIANLQLKYDWPVLSDYQLRNLTGVAQAIANLTNQPQFSRQPYVGPQAFSFHSRYNAEFLQQHSELFWHVNPKIVGNRRRSLADKLADADVIAHKVAELDLAELVTDEQALLAAVHAREVAGYSYQTADASFELLAREVAGVLQLPFEVPNWQLATDESGNKSQALLQVSINGETKEVSASGNGPVDALGAALIELLKPNFPQVLSYRLVDYRVRILTESQGIGGMIRVLIDTTNGEQTWTTVGVGTSVLEASWEALSDAYRYGLIKGY